MFRVEQGVPLPGNSTWDTQQQAIVYIGQPLIANLLGRDGNRIGLPVFGQRIEVERGNKFGWDLNREKTVAFSDVFDFQMHQRFQHAKRF